MDTIQELSAQLSTEHPELCRAVEKVASEITELYYGAQSIEYNSNGRPFLSREVMKRANSKRIDHVEFFLAFFTPDLRAAFLIKLALKFKNLSGVWYNIHNSFSDKASSEESDREQVEFLHALFIQWIDENLPKVMEGSYQSRGNWF